MLSRIVTAKLKESRRLVITNLGVFIVREDGHILFSELMRNDDGVLRAAVAADGGTGEGDAARTVERFVADIRHSLEHGMSYRLEGLGVLMRDERGLTVFKSREEEEQRHTAERSARANITRILAESAKEEVPEKPQESVPTVEPEPEPKAEPKPETEPVAPETKEAPTPIRRPRRRRKGRGGADMFLIVAIAVALAAVAIILYGFWVSSNRDDSYGDISVPDTEQTDADTEEDSDVFDLSIPSGRK